MSPMDRAKAKRVLAEVERRANDASRIDWDALCFGPQRDFVNDPSKLVAALCSRRAGKTNGIAVRACKVALRYPGTIIPYITLTKAQAKRNLWDLCMKELSLRLKLKLEYNKQEGVIYFPNGSQIVLSGADDEAEVERFRGGKYRLVFLDEAQKFRAYIRQLVIDVIEPGVVDYDGTIVVTGTPGPLCMGFFFDITTGVQEGWSVHKWTLLENPHMPNAAAWLEKRRKTYGWTENSPTYMREYRGIWVADTNGMVYHPKPFTPQTEIPEADDWRYILGIDMGFNDPCAFVVLAYSVRLAKVFAVESYKQAGLIPSAAAAHVERLMARYDFDRIVADTGGLGKGYAEEMKQRFGLPIQAAKKTEKLSYIGLMNGDMANGTLHLLEKGNAHLIEEMAVLQWDDTKTRESPSQPNHLCDALLYGWRECHAFLHESEMENPVFGSKEYWAKEEAMLEQNAREEIERSTNRESWWESLHPDSWDE